MHITIHIVMLKQCVYKNECGERFWLPITPQQYQGKFWSLYWSNHLHNLNGSTTFQLVLLQHGQNWKMLWMEIEESFLGPSRRGVNKLKYRPKLTWFYGRPRPNLKVNSTLYLLSIQRRRFLRKSYVGISI